MFRWQPRRDCGRRADAESRETRTEGDRHAHTKACIISCAPHPQTHDPGALAVVDDPPPRRPPGVDASSAISHGQMDARRRTTIAQDASGIPVTARRPAPGVRASVAGHAPAGGASGASLLAPTAGSRYSMAPQRTIRASMLPPSAQHHPTASTSAPGHLGVPASATRMGHTYGGQAPGASGRRGDAGVSRASHVPAATNAPYLRPSERRSSQGRRQSNPSHQSTLQAFVSLYGPARPGLKDPRNLRQDAAARARCSNDVADFLIERRYPGEAKVTQQTITQKDFESTFKFLYTLFDPAHGPWIGKFEDEVTKRCVPTCGYPFASEVNRSSLQTVGAKHSWHVILGLLHWLTVAVKVRETAFDLYPEVRIDADAPDVDDALERPQAKVEFWAEYLSRSYPLFLASEDYEQSLEPHLAKLRDRFEAYQERSHQHIAELKEASDEIEMELKRIESVPNELEIKQQEHSKLQKDLESLDTFMQTLERRSQHVKKQLDEFKKRIRDLEEAKKARHAERAKLQDQVSAQNLSDAEVQRLTTDRQLLDDQARTYTERDASLSKEGTQHEVELRRVTDRVEKQCDEYATRLSRRGLIPRPPPGDYGHLDFQQEINGSAVNPSDMVPDPTRSAGLRPALVRMRQQANMERNKHIDGALLVETDLNKLNERIAELKEMLAEAEIDHHTHKEELDAAKEALSVEMHSANAELERRERENVELRNNLSGGTLGADQRLQALGHEHTRLIAAVERSRKENTDCFAESLDLIIGFKDFVRTKVDDLYSIAKET